MALNDINYFKKTFFLFFRHGIVSLTCGSIEFILFLLLFTYLKVGLPISYFISFAIATVVGFLGHSFFTFEIGEFRQRNAIFFLIQALCALALGYLIVAGLIHAGTMPAIAKIFQLVIIFFFNVTFGKVISFRKFNAANNDLQ